MNSRQEDCRTTFKAEHGAYHFSESKQVSKPMV